jgi:hypothetical protein
VRVAESDYCEQAETEPIEGYETVAARANSVPMRINNASTIRSQAVDSGVPRTREDGA